MPVDFWISAVSITAEPVDLQTMIVYGMFRHIFIFYGIYEVDIACLIPVTFVVRWIWAQNPAFNSPEWQSVISRIVIGRFSQFWKMSHESAILAKFAIRHAETTERSTVDDSGQNVVICSGFPSVKPFF
jgi:hypothetical protein